MYQFGRVGVASVEFELNFPREVMPRRFDAQLLPEVAAATSGLRDRRDGVLKNQLLVGTGFEQDRKLVETANAAGQLGAVNQENNDRGSFAAQVIEKPILNVLRRRLQIRHDHTLTS